MSNTKKSGQRDQSPIAPRSEDAHVPGMMRPQKPKYRRYLLFCSMLFIAVPLAWGLYPLYKNSSRGYLDKPVVVQEPAPVALEKPQSSTAVVSRPDEKKVPANYAGHPVQGQAVPPYPPAEMTETKPEEAPPLLDSPHVSEAAKAAMPGGSRYRSTLLRVDPDFIRREKYKSRLDVLASSPNQLAFHGKDVAVPKDSNGPKELSESSPLSGRVLEYKELSQQMRKDISLSISMLVYSDLPAARSMTVNGVRMREGQGTPDGLLLREIKPKGAVFEYKGLLFFKNIVGN